MLALIRDNEDLLLIPVSTGGNVDIKYAKSKGCDYRICAVTDRLRLLYKEKQGETE